MNMPSFAADASLYANRRHYRAAAANIGGTSHSILAQSLFCSRSGQSCGGIDLVCCPGLRCTAGLASWASACPSCSTVLHASMVGKSVARPTVLACAAFCGHASRPYEPGRGLDVAATPRQEPSARDEAGIKARNRCRIRGEPERAETTIE